MSPTDILKQLVKVDSRVSKSNLKILTTIQQLIGQPGKLERFTKTSPAKLKLGNLFYRFDGVTDEPPIILIGHTDTVEAASDWATDPFKPTVRRKRLVSLGSADMKAGLAAMIILARRAQQRRPQRPLVLIFDADEEGEVDGAENVLKHHRFHDAWVIIPEATGNSLSLGQRACLDFRVRTKGFALPSSLATNNRENSALYRANRILDALIHDEESRINKLSDRRFGKGIQSIGQIRGGTASNAVADRVEFWGTRRLLPNQDLADEARQLRKLVRSADPTASVHFPFRGEGFLTEPSSPLIQALKPLISNRETTYQSGWTEAGAFQHWGEVVVFGPGESAVTHTANESLKLQQLTDYVGILNQFVFENPSANPGTHRE